MDANLLARLRLLTNEPDASGLFADDAVERIFLANAESVPATAAEMWEIKAAAASELVDVSEAQSSRSNSQVGKSALSMAALYRAQAETSGSGVSPSGRRPAATRPIERA